MALDALVGLRVCLTGDEMGKASADPANVSPVVKVALARGGSSAPSLPLNHSLFEKKPLRCKFALWKHCSWGCVCLPCSFSPGKVLWSWLWCGQATHFLFVRVRAFCLGWLIAFSSENTLFVCKTAITESVWLTLQTPRCKNILVFLKTGDAFFKIKKQKRWLGNIGFARTWNFGLRIVSSLGGFSAVHHQNRVCGFLLVVGRTKILGTHSLAEFCLGVWFPFLTLVIHLFTYLTLVCKDEFHVIV